MIQHEILRLAREYSSDMSKRHPGTVFDNAYAIVKGEPTSIDTVNMATFVNVMDWLSDKYLLVGKDTLVSNCNTAKSIRNNLQQIDAFFRDPFEYGRQCGITDILEYLFPDDLKSDDNRIGKP